MKAITYCVSDSEKAEIEAYAKEKGLKDASALARFAVARYMAQYPAKGGENGKK